jgi:hypothetical protein
VVYRNTPHQIDCIRLIAGGLLRSLRGTWADWLPQRASPGYSVVFMEFVDGRPAVAIQNAYGYFFADELVAILGPDTVEAERQIYNAFGQKFGLKMTLVGGPADEVVNRVLAERSQGLYTVDIAGLGGNGTRRAVTAKLFTELTPQLFHPDILDRSGWRVSWFPWSSDHPDRKYVTL